MRAGATVIMTTHILEIAERMADRIGVMREGRLMQIGTPAAIYERPNSRWIAEFIGDVNLIEAKVLATEPDGLLKATGSVGPLRAVSPLDCKSGDTVWVALRPEKVRLSCERPAASEANCVTGKVCNIAYLGEHLAYKVRLESGFTMKATLPNTTRVAEQRIRSDDRVWLSWSEDAAAVLTR